MSSSSKPLARRPARVREPGQRPQTSFTPVATRKRHDGWTPDRQTAFIDALAESGCVAEACATASVSRVSAYRLRARPDAQGFRLAWDAALDYAIRRLSDECLSRALNGVAVPHFYKGEQIGEHRRYDNRLAIFLLRYRDPLRYAATLDEMVYTGHVESAAIRLARARDRVADEAWGFPDADPAPDRLPFSATPIVEARAAAEEDLLAQTDEPIRGGSRARRERIQQRRAARHAEAAAARKADSKSCVERFEARIRAMEAEDEAARAAAGSAGEGFRGVT